MAFRHFGATPPPVHAAWKCPTCGASNTGPLEAGCPACKAGADAAVAAVQPEAERAPALVQAAYVEWANNRQKDYIDPAQAFAAGAAWQRQQLDPVLRQAAAAQPTIPSTRGGYRIMVQHPEGLPQPVEQRTHETILAALAFYRDNQLAYGPVPGQLSAGECTALIEQLTPVEAEEQK